MCMVNACRSGRGEGSAPEDTNLVSQINLARSRQTLPPVLRLIKLFVIPQGSNGSPGIRLGNRRGMIDMRSFTYMGYE